MTSKVAFHTLGCKLNFTDTSEIAQQFADAGYTRTSFDEVADIYVVNTCSVTENADRECKSIINKIQRTAPYGIIVITGCYAQLKPEYIAQIPGVDLVIGAQSKFNIVEHVRKLVRNGGVQIEACNVEDVKTFHPAQSGTERTRIFMKVQDGCNYQCSFCTIPLARGSSRSDTISNVLQRIESAIKTGAKEIVLTGVNLGDFGIDAEKNHRVTDFFALLLAIEKADYGIRFRLSSTEPNLLTDEIINLVASSKVFMPHFHLPLQSGSDKILRSMRRRYNTGLYRSRINAIKNMMPHACIGADVITGYPGENEQDFLDTYNFLDHLEISYLHVFTYSERHHTHAITLSQVVPHPERKLRTQKLIMLSNKKMVSHIARHMNHTLPVLFENNSNNGNTMHGYTDNYIKVTHPYQTEYVNRVVDCTLVKMHNNNHVEVAITQAQLV